MKNTGKNSNGFVSLSFVFILMTFLSLYFTSVFAIALSQQRDYVRTICVTEATELQMATLKNARNLFALNKYSTLLRRSITAAKATLALAAATANAPLAATTERILNGLYRSQEALDKMQKAMLFKAKAELIAKHSALIVKANAGQYELTQPWKYMIRMLGGFSPQHLPTFAVRPDSEGGIGPNYEWEQDAEKKLTLAYSWKMGFSTRSEYQTFFKWMNILSAQCSVAPNLKEEKWELTINVDKSSPNTF